jgi:hypothetical protein
MRLWRISRPPTPFVERLSSDDIIKPVKKRSYSKLFAFAGLLLAGVLLLMAAFPAIASSPAQVVYFTPTPRPDGRIIYVVKAGDTCLSISLLNRIDIAKLRDLNGLAGTDCIIRPNQELLLGLAGPAETPTIGPSPTPTPLLPTPTPFAGNGSVCVLLYEDLNGNGIREETERSMDGGAVSLGNASGSFTRRGTSVVVPDPTVNKPLCFDDVPEGKYTISIAVPQGYNATTSTNYALDVKAGTTSTLNFGCQVSLVAATPVPVETPRSPLLGIFGGALILLGAGLAIYLRKTTK